MSGIRETIEELENRIRNLRTELVEVKAKHRPIIKDLTSQLEDARLRKKVEIGQVLNQIIELDEEIATYRAILARAMQETLNMPEVSDVFE
jgi:archaellum component FlaC